jgi:hypothetical protein
LLFADDTLLFFKADGGGHVERVKHIIDMYAQSTCQLIDPAKCSIYFSKSYLEDTQEVVCSTLHIQREQFEDKYLGLPTPEGRMNRGKF